MPNKSKTDLDSGSESEKSHHDSGSGSDGEEEEYVVEKVVDKRFSDKGKVCIMFVSTPASFLPQHASIFRLSTS
jgi:hypothetical protein